MDTRLVRVGMRRPQFVKTTGFVGVIEIMVVNGDERTILEPSHEWPVRETREQATADATRYATSRLGLLPSVVAERTDLTEDFPAI